MSGAARSLQSIRTTPCHGAETVLRVTIVFTMVYATILSAVGQARVILNAGDAVSTLAGNGRDSKTSAGPALSTGMGHPRSIIYDRSGNLYLADSRNNQVTRLTPGGTLTVIAGTGEEGFSGDGGSATTARLSQPSALALPADGTLLIADTGNHRLRSVSPGGIITTVAGTGVPGNSGDGGPAIEATLRRPSGLALDSAGNLLVADTGNHRIRRISPSGTITGVAGTGEEGDDGDGSAAADATFRTPSALLALPDGRVLIGDTAARRVRVLQTDGTVAAYVSTGSLRRPEGMALGSTGELVLADGDLQQVLQRPATAVAALAGNGAQGPFTAGPAQATTLNSPVAVAAAADGIIAIADRGNHQVQRLDLPAMDFGSIPAGQRSKPQQLTVLNGGTSVTQVTALTLPTGFDTASVGDCGAVPIRLAAGQKCMMELTFAPTAQGASSGFATVVSDTAPTAALRLTGVAIQPSALVPSRTALTSNGTIAYTGAPVLVTASVTGNLAAAPEGNVTFTDGANALTVVAISSGKGTFSTAALSAGTHSLQAAYSGDARYASSTSQPVLVTVVLSPDFGLSASAASYAGKTSAAITVPLTCTPQNGTLNQSAALSVSGLPGGFTATLSPPSFQLGANPVFSTLTIIVPATVAQQKGSPLPLAAGLILLPLVLSSRRKLCALTLGMCAVWMSGCGGGFRAVSSGSSSATHRYNITVTATTTGVLGDTLAHSIPVELVITP